MAEPTDHGGGTDRRTGPRLAPPASLGPSVNAKRRLSRAELHFLTAVNSWLPQARPSIVVPMRERSWQLVGDDRALEGMRSGRLFGPGRLTLEILRCRSSWPPVHERVFGGGRWLVVENWSTFESLCAVAALADSTGGSFLEPALR